MTDREKVLAWLKHTGEKDQAVIDEVIAQCKVDPEARAYYVGRSSEINRFADKVKALREKVAKQHKKASKALSVPKTDPFVDRKRAASGDVE